MIYYKCYLILKKNKMMKKSKKIIKREIKVK